MTASETLANAVTALGIPASARVDRRVPKTMLLEKAPTTADRRLINERIEEFVWVARLRPDNVGIHAFFEDDRDYREIAVLQLTVRAAKAAKTVKPTKTASTRLFELVHRAIPYPVVLWSANVGDASVDAPPLLTLAHKRVTQASGAIVIDELHSSSAEAAPSAERFSSFCSSLTIAQRPHANLRDLYQGWIDCITALQVAVITSDYRAPTNATTAATQRDVLQQHARTLRELARLRVAAGRESQINKRVELNTAIKAAEATLASLNAALTPTNCKEPRQ